MFLYFRSNQTFFILLIFLSLFFFASQTNGTTPGFFVDPINGEPFSWKPKVIRRSMVDQTVENKSLVLAAERTRRRDPLDHFNRYTGGWNMSNKHYIASVGFTAAPFFIFGGVWFLLFGLCLCILCICHFCCRKQPYGYSPVAYILSLIFLIIFTVAAIAGCVLLYTGQGQLHSNTTDTWRYVIMQANLTSESLRNVSNYLAAAQTIGVDSVTLPEKVQNDIDSVQDKIDTAATFLHDKTKENAKKIQDGLDTMRVALIIIAAVMLSLVFLGFLFSIFGLQCLVYSLVMFAWILVACTFVLCGVFLLLHNVLSDSCFSMKQWVDHPTAHTALDDILPCVDHATAEETRLRTKDVTHQLVDLVGTVISNVCNKDYPPDAGIFYYNQSGPMMPVICNPFNPDITERQCLPEEVDLSNAIEVWKKYACEVSAISGYCNTPGRLTPMFYNQMVAAVNVSYALYHYGPFLTDLQDCTFVRKTFTDITTMYCPGMERSTKWIYIGLLTVSAAVMCSIIFWVVYARERKHRVYTKQLMTQSPRVQDETL